METATAWFPASSSGRCCCLPHPRYSIRPAESASFVPKSWKKQQSLALGAGKIEFLRTVVPARVAASNGTAAPAAPDASNEQKLDEVYEVKEHTVDAQAPKGRLSPAAINAIEQFSRLNGLTGKRMRANFESFAPVAIQNEARNLVEFCCFRYLAKGSQDFHPSLKDAAFRRLTFVTMLGWQQPYEDSSQNTKDNLVSEEAFVRIAPAIPGVADRLTAHSLFRTLTAGAAGLSFGVWDHYLVEICSVMQGREEFRRECDLDLEPDECPVCVGANGGQPVQKWEHKIAWPGSLVLTDRALHFQPFRLVQQTKWSRLDITGKEASVERKKIGPFQVELFDSAISVAASSSSEPWLLEFIDFSGKGRRDFWFLYIKELLSAYKFIREYAPKEDDPSLEHVYGAKAGWRRALNSALLSIARVQAVQAMLGSPPHQPQKLLQFSQIEDAPHSDLVLQALAVEFWAGRTNHSEEEVEPGNVVGTDGSIYLRRWMTSESWKSQTSISFWKQRSHGIGVVLGKNLVVGGIGHLERAVDKWKQQNDAIEMRKAAIDSAKISGIPENIELLKELLSPLQAVADELGRLRSWKQPLKTILFLMCFYGLLYRNWLQYTLAVSLGVSTIAIFAIRGLKASGYLSPEFEKVSITEQPPSNTIQKLLALKQALADGESLLQRTNIVLLKIRTLLIYSIPEATNWVLFLLIAASLFLTVVPFRITLGLLVLDQFTMELELRKPMVEELWRRVKTWWDSIPATPVEVRPYEKPEPSTSQITENPAIKVDILTETLKEWFGD